MHRAGNRTLNSRNDLAWLLAASGVRGAAVEIGVAEGMFASIMLAGWKGCTSYTMIDPWKDQTKRFGVKTGNLVTMRSGQAITKAFCKVQAHFSQSTYRGKVQQIRRSSSDAASLLEDSSLAFLYVDGNHYYKWVVEDLHLYWPKVRPGGILAGHDYEWRWMEPNGPDTWNSPRNPERGGVKNALQEFAAQHGLRYFLTQRMHGGKEAPWCCPSWYLFKPLTAHTPQLTRHDSTMHSTQRDARGHPPPQSHDTSNDVLKTAHSRHHERMEGLAVLSWLISWLQAKLSHVTLDS